MVVRWKFYDPATNTTWTFTMNPSDGGSPEYGKTLTYAKACGPGGAILPFEGRPDPQKLEFSGRILLREHYDAFVSWTENSSPIELTDDLGRTFTITIEKFSPKRKKSARYPWKHDFTCNATVLIPV